MTRKVGALVAKCRSWVPRRIHAIIPGWSKGQVAAGIHDHAHIPPVLDTSRLHFLTSSQDRVSAGSAASDTPLFEFPAMGVRSPEPSHDSTVFFWTALDVQGFDTEAPEEPPREAPRRPRRGGSLR
jgi:hypothetical protein